jgi:hypothetical protein
MIKLESLELALDVESLLTPKKSILSLARKVNGSMLAFHKEIKTSYEIEQLAESFFKTRNDLNLIKNKSQHLRSYDLTDKIDKLKSMRIDSVDFI